MRPSEHRLYQQPWPEGAYRFFQLGFVVVDLFAAAERWARVFGVGPFHVLPARPAECTYRGKPSTVDMQVAVAQAGPAQIELIHQPDDEPSILREVFPKGTGGFHQLCTVTRDFDGLRAHYEAHGHPLACEIDVPGAHVAYYDTLADFGFITEVVEETPEFLRHTSEVAAACRDWDGSDPVRILTRDGYRTP